VPASKILEMLWLDARCIVKSKIRIPLIKAPINAIKKLPVLITGDTAEMATASEAPCVTPNTEGSAIGLRITPCIIVPVNASIPPVRTAHSIRGRRTSRTNCALIESSG